MFYCGHSVDKVDMQKMGYTKLFSEIVMSTIWREPDHVRLLWITMLALKDQFQTVNASLPSLADAARITLKDCEKAITVLESPDKYSRSSEFEGRRIQPCDGGWLILNGEKYQQKLSKEERREYKTMKQREYRSRGQELTNVDKSGRCRHNKNKNKNNTLKPSNSDELDFIVFWGFYPKKENKKKSEIAYNSLTKSQKEKAINDIKTRFIGRKKVFVPLATTYIHGERWEDEKENNISSLPYGAGGK